MPSKNHHQIEINFFEQQLYFDTDWTSIQHGYNSAIVTRTIATPVCSYNYILNVEYIFSWSLTWLPYRGILWVVSKHAKSSWAGRLSYAEIKAALGCPSWCAGVQRVLDIYVGSTTWKANSWWKELNLTWFMLKPIDDGIHALYKNSLNTVVLPRGEFLLRHCTNTIVETDYNVTLL